MQMRMLWQLCNSLERHGLFAFKPAFIAIGVDLKKIQSELGIFRDQLTMFSSENWNNGA